MAGGIKEIVVREGAGIPRSGEIVRAAVPCVRGEFSPEQQLAVSGPGGAHVTCQLTPLKQWPDGSLKWLLVDFPASVSPWGTETYHLKRSEVPSQLAGQVRVRPGTAKWEVDTGRASFTIDARTFRPFSAVRREGTDASHTPVASCHVRFDGEAPVDAAVTEIAADEAGPLRAVIRLAGCFTALSRRELRFICRMHFLAGSSAVKLEFTLHNPSAARHPGGLWDLGDEGSLLFRELNFSFCAPDASSKTHFMAPQLEAPLDIRGALFSLYHESSGGENWNSPVHRNRDGRVPMTRRGYVVEVEGKEVAAGPRVTPVVWHGENDGMAVAVPCFWQAFPGEITAGEGRITFAPFPARFPALHELQGGEQVTHEFWIDFATEKEGLAWALAPLHANAAPHVYRASKVLHDLPGDDDLADRFTTPDDLLKKREAADEFGWRNFGDVHADHEAAFCEDPGLFVSHYNNQYDCIGGLYRKFFATGDPAWGGLARDLARHVRDIDLYHTDRDREEYNRGLFWHTDHYIDAGLSTHRSYSLEQVQARNLQSGGGGPGAEHCYTTGLMYHYFQTGNPLFRQAVIDLAKWGLCALQGAPTVLGAAKRAAGYLARWKSGRGEKSLFPRYPFTRGTGNVLTACLDAFELGGGGHFLKEANALIRGALHHADDIEARELHNAETAWSYTVLLVAVARYMDKKAELGEADADFRYARDAFLAYAEWMAGHEFPYLDKPQILEYPTETWAAQDLRKSVIFFQASLCCETDRSAALREKAIFFYEHSVKELVRRPSTTFARPVALLLQNGWVGESLRRHRDLDPCPAGCSAAQKNDGEPVPHLGLGSVASRILSELFMALRKSSVSRELAWLRSRL